MSSSQEKSESSDDGDDHVPGKRPKQDDEHRISKSIQDDITKESTNSKTVINLSASASGSTLPAVNMQNASRTHLPSFTAGI